MLATVGRQCLIGVFLLTAAIFPGISISLGEAISRYEIIARAQYWERFSGYEKTQFYHDQDGEYYKRDAAGYISMAWRLPSNATLQSLLEFSKEITKDELDTGDIIIDPKLHAVIFNKWTSDENVSYFAYQYGGYGYTGTLKFDYPHKSNEPDACYRHKYLCKSGDYKPYRLSDIEEGIVGNMKISGTDGCECPKENLDARGEFKFPYAGITNIHCGEGMSGKCKANSIYHCLFLPNKPTIFEETPCPFHCEFEVRGSVRRQGSSGYLPDTVSKCSLKPKATPITIATTSRPKSLCQCPAENPYTIAVGKEVSTDDYCGSGKAMRGICNSKTLYSCLFRSEGEPLLAIEKYCPFGCETVPFGIHIGSGIQLFKSRCADSEPQVFHEKGQDQDEVSYEKTPYSGSGSHDRDIETNSSSESNGIYWAAIISFSAVVFLFSS